MATGHILPGYGDPVSRLRRVQSAGFPLDKKTLLDIAQQTRLEQQQFESIRNNARRLWSYPDRNETSYDNHFAERPADELMQLRPTSPTRRNKPHPPMVFLTTRLHYIPGYNNADTTVGKEAYQVDASVPVDQQAERKAVRRKYLGRQDPAMVNTYKDPFGLRQTLDGRSAQAAEAWMKLADDADRDNVLHVIQREKDKARTRDVESLPRAKTAYPSTYRWMRYAGAKESDSVGRIVNTLNSDPDGTCYIQPNPYHARPVQSVTSMRMRDIASTRNVRYQSKPSRGDFLIHPDWPPTLEHHKVL
ncbi:hypothetical protein BaRGS_00013467 [Batillaria attramentaria]|uniref:Uncharacterized protein n=1 Tax=Batillaria attramentaria TaxID=370345 RepID=A0ABD0L7Q7_9CAEN